MSAATASRLPVSLRSTKTQKQILYAASTVAALGALYLLWVKVISPRACCGGPDKKAKKKGGAQRPGVDSPLPYYSPSKAAAPSSSLSSGVADPLSTYAKKA